MNRDDCNGLMKFDIIKSNKGKDESWVVFTNDPTKERIVANDINTTDNKQKIISYDELIDRFNITYKFIEKEAIIGTDNDGWSIYKLKIKEILKFIGAKEINGVLGFQIDDPILNVYPVTYELDEDGYGVKPKYITEVDISENDHIDIFIEPKQ